MSNLGEKDNSATVDLSNVTVRKPKKSKPKDVTGVDDIVNDVHLENVASSIKMKHDYIVALFGISLTSPNEINEFFLSCEAGKYPIWAELDNNARNMVMDALDYLCNAFEVKATSKTIKPFTESPLVQDVNINTNVTSNVGATGVRDVSFRPLVAEPDFEGVNVSIPRTVVEKVSTRLEHTLYGYFIGNRIAFPVVEYFARNNWGKHGLKRIMMNSKGFFFFKFDTLAGLEAVLEGGPWMIRKSPIILKKWSMDTNVHKEELTRIPVWVKLHDVPLQVFEEDGISLIATFIGKPIMLDPYTSSMCKDSWGRSSFARCLIEINSDADLVDVVTIGFPSLSGEGFTKATIRVEYEWRPPRCNVCMIFGHTHDHCPKKVVSPPVASYPQVGNPSVVLDNDGFQMAGKNKKKGKGKSTIGNRFVGPSVKQNVKYVPKATPSEPKKNSTSMGKDSISSNMLKSTGTTSKEGVEAVIPDSGKDLVTVKGTMNMKELVPHLKEKFKRNVDVVPPKKEENKGGVEAKDDKKEKNESGGDKKEKKESGGDGDARAPSGGEDKNKSIEVVNKLEYQGHGPYTHTMPVYNQSYYNQGYNQQYNQHYYNQDYGVGPSSSNGYVYQGYNHGNAMEYSHAPPPLPPPSMYINDPRVYQADTGMFSDENPNACSVM